MKVTIEIDDDLLKEAFKYAKVSSKKDLINLALVEFVNHHDRKNLLHSRGKVKIDKNYNYGKRDLND